jgi:carbon monoxide dehydrogenase subunit G
MDMTGEYRIEAPREVVWRGLNDPNVLKQCIPGCESIEKLSDTELTAKVALSIGPVKARFTGKVTLSDLDPPNGYKITGEGQGGVAGFGKGGATVTLQPDGNATVLRYVATASVGGKIAQLGARLVDATAKKLADEFFSKFQAALGPVAAAEPAAVAAPAGDLAPAPATTIAPSPAGAPASRGLAPIVWIPALIVIIAIITWLFVRQ